mgnify:CR=1 FL=1
MDTTWDQKIYGFEGVNFELANFINIDHRGNNKMAFVKTAVRNNFLMRPLAKWYQKTVFNKCAEFGIRYEDLLIENDDLYKAHEWSSKETMAMRDRRIKRAVDMSMKHTHLPKEIAALQDPGNFYLSDNIKEAKKLREERELIQG